MEETSAAGPYDQWPLGRGFDRYYGFIQGETDQFIPELYYDNHPVDPPKTPEQGYHLSEDLIDRSIGFIRDQKSAIPERPFFLYLCFGATHAPHQAPPNYIEKYRGRFDAGWDKVRQDWFERQKKLGIIPADTELAPRNPGVEPWDSLSDNQKKLALRLQEAFAGFLDHTDAQIGRLVEFLEQIGELDNTALFLMSDNGASQEGGPNGIVNSMQYFNGLNPSVDDSLKQLDEIGGPLAHNNYPWGWAQVGNCPGKRYKQNTHGGGIRDPLVVHWPQGVRDPGSIRHQFHHVTDIAPTVLEIVGVEAAATVNGIPQMPIHGQSLAYTFAEEARTAPTTKQVQYFEMFGHRGIWANGWKAVAYHNAGQPFESDDWELYHLDKDFSECRNLAKSHPEKLREMVDLWWIEAGKNGVLPLDDRRQELWRPTPRKRTPRNRRRYVILPPVGHINSDVAPAIGNRTFKITAEIDRPTANSQGCLVSYGASTNGLVALHSRRPRGVRLQSVPQPLQGGVGSSGSSGRVERRRGVRAPRQERPGHRADQRRCLRHRRNPVRAAHDLDARHGYRPRSGRCRLDRLRCTVRVRGYDQACDVRPAGSWSGRRTTGRAGPDQGRYGAAVVHEEYWEHVLSTARPRGRGDTVFAKQSTFVLRPLDSRFRGNERAQQPTFLRRRRGS